jgi:hypothetical protein
MNLNAFGRMGLWANKDIIRHLTKRIEETANTLRMGNQYIRLESNKHLRIGI